MTKAKFIFDKNTGFNQVKVGEDVDSTISANVDSVTLDIADMTLNGDVTVNGVARLDKVSESYTELSNATGVVVHDCSTSHVFYHTTPAANWTVNLTNLNLADGFATSITLVIIQGATARIPTAIQIAGLAQVLNWQGNVVPSGTANRQDVVSFSILNAGGAYTVLGQLVSF